MLVIRGPQLAVFDELQRRRFEENAIGYLREHFPGELEARGETAVRAALPAALNRAAKYGIERGADVLAWIGLEWLLGEQFEQRPENAWMLDLLKSPILAPEGKVPAILEEMRHHPESLDGRPE